MNDLIEDPPIPPQPPPDPSVRDMVNYISAIDNAPGTSTPIPSCQPHRVSPIRFSLPAEEDILGLEEVILGFQSTDFPPGSLS